MGGLGGLSGQNAALGQSKRKSQAAHFTRSGRAGNSSAAIPSAARRMTARSSASWAAGFSTDTRSPVSR